jgi:GH15 family glucan-1,4-alpha-glucosidase
MGALKLGRHVASFRTERDAIAAEIEARGFNREIASYTGAYDDDKVDASLLLMVCLGYKDASDPRMIATYDRIHRQLGRNGLLYRYERTDEAKRGKEGAFGICSFWAVDNLVRRGDVAEAERLFEHVLGFANDLGLFGEEIDPDSGAALGNFPQGFTHIGLITAALAISGAQHAKRAA